MKKLLFAAVSVFLIVLNLSAVALVKAGKSNAVIVVADSANPTQRMASQELSMFIEKRTGAKIPILKKGAKVPAGVFPIYLGISEEAKKTRSEY